MAVTFTLTSTLLTTIDFTTGTDFTLESPDYVPVVATPTGDGSIPPYVTETLPVTVRATSENDLALSMQELAALARRAAEYWVDQQQTAPVWFNCKLDTETTGRRALVKRIDYEFRPAIQGIYEDCGTTTLADYYLGTILVERHPYWERALPRVFPTAVGAAGVVDVYDYTAAGPELLSNTGFEIAGVGGADVFGTWVENAGDGTITDEGVIVNNGAHACKFTAGASADTYVHQAHNVGTYGAYTLTLHSRGDGTNAGRYRIYDTDNAADITALTSTGIPGAVYGQVTDSFTVPAGCGNVRIELHCPTANGGICYFDDIFLTLDAHDIVGDVGARIAELTLDPFAGDLFGRVWIGLRSANRHASLVNFEATWECEDGTLNDGGGGESGIQIDAASDVNGASPGSGSGSYVEVVETDLNWDDEWHLVLDIDLDQITANEADNFGTFLWLLRAQITAGTWEVQLRYGCELMGDDDYKRGVITEVGDATWNIYETDIQGIPIHDRRAFALPAGADAGFSVQIWAQRTDGAGDLYLDALYPIPIDEGFCALAEFSDDEYISVATGPMDNVAAAVWTPVQIYDVPSVAPSAFYLPLGDGRMVIAFARAASSDFTATLLYESFLVDREHGTHYERWAALRGAE